MLLLRILCFGAGTTLVISTIMSAIRTFVLPRPAISKITTFVFVAVYRLFLLVVRFKKTYEQRDRIMALYVPLTLLMLPPVWLALVMLGYTGIFWGLGIDPWLDALKLSGSSLLTLGFANPDGLVTLICAFSEAVVGLILVALLIAYLPTMYTAFSRRELAVTLLAVRAGSPPSAVEMLERTYRIGGLGQLGQTWASWETWFAEVEESHTSLAALTFFRSRHPSESWVVASGTILDAAALSLAMLDLPAKAEASLCIRAGYLCLRRISDYYGITYNAKPRPDDPISVTRAEFDSAYERLAQAGLPLRENREQAWRDFAGWRVNYDTVLLALADLTMAPYALWSSDRAPQRPPPAIWRRTR
jgi:hypothetical protein